MSIERTEIADLGEFGLIERLASKFSLQHKSSRLGIGDDAAIVSPPASHELLVSTDMLMEGVHFDLSYVPLRHLGYKAMAVNISDIAAMNAHVSQVVVSLAMSNRFSVEAIEELYEGMKLACDTYGIDLVGGDTSNSRQGLVISVTAIGFATPEKIVRRSGAQPGDLLCVSGDLGAAYLGLQILEREKQVFMQTPDVQPDLTDFEYVVGRQLKPEPRIDMVERFEKLGIMPSAMIDISDGLASEVLHICKKSNCGAVVFEDHLPIHKDTYDTAEKLNMSVITAVLNGGEDYELLFTIPQKDYQKIELDPFIQIIGHIDKPDKGASVRMRSGQFIDMKAQGWNHF
ncbi:MAG: thiamine-phosphate kinase [Bernardetiaceae bacterium]|nr:thiamine-phosphate kinase [Bernardetiaceae bacterium]